MNTVIIKIKTQEIDLISGGGYCFCNNFYSEWGQCPSHQSCIAYCDRFNGVFRFVPIPLPEGFDSDSDTDDEDGTHFDY